MHWSILWLLKIIVVHSCLNMSFRSRQSAYFQQCCMKYAPDLTFPRIEHWKLLTSDRCWDVSLHRKFSNSPSLSMPTGPTIEEESSRTCWHWRCHQMLTGLPTPTEPNSDLQGKLRWTLGHQLIRMSLGSWIWKDEQPPFLVTKETPRASPVSFYVLMSTFEVRWKSVERKKSNSGVKVETSNSGLEGRGHGINGSLKLRSSWGISLMWKAQEKPIKKYLNAEYTEKETKYSY